MNYSFVRRFFWFVLLSLLLGSSLILSGCDSGGSSSPDPELKNGVALSGSDQSDVAAVATHEEGEWLTAYSREDPNQVSEVVYGAGDGNRATIKLDGEGRPSIAVTGPYVLTFGNYNGNRADVALVDTRTGEIKTFDQVDLGADFESLNLSKSGAKNLSPEEATEAASYGATAFICSMAAIPAPDSPFTGAGCAASVLLQVGTEAAEQAGWGDTAQWVGFGVDVGECGAEHGFGPSCYEGLIDAAGIVLEEDEGQIDESEEDVAQASGVARFGGVWKRQDIGEAWFVVEKEKVFDAFYNSNDDCYDLTIGDFVSVDGDIFTYKNRSAGTEVSLKYERQGESGLWVERLNDGSTWTMNYDSSQDTDNFLNNQCGSPSMVPASQLITP